MSIKIDRVSDEGIHYTWTKPSTSDYISMYQIHTQIVVNGSVMSDTDSAPYEGVGSKTTDSSTLEWPRFMGGDSDNIEQYNICDDDVRIRIQSYSYYETNKYNNPNIELYEFTLDGSADYEVSADYLIKVSDVTFTERPSDSTLDFNWSITTDLVVPFEVYTPGEGFEIYYTALPTSDINIHKETIRNATYSNFGIAFDGMRSGTAGVHVEDDLIPGQTYYCLIGVKSSIYSGGTHIDYAPQLITYTVPFETPSNIKFCNANGEWVSARAYFCVPTDGDPVFREINLNTAQML